MCAPLNDYIHTQLFSYPQVKRMKILDQFQECIARETAVKQFENYQKKNVKLPNSTKYQLGKHHNCICGYVNTYS